VKKILSLIGILMTTSPAWANEAAAAGHAPGIPWDVIVKQAVNFAILAVVLVYFLRKPLSSFLQERTELLKKAISEAAAARAEAARKLADIEAKVSALPAEIAAIDQRMDAEGADEARKIREAGAAEAARILKQAEQTASQEVMKAREELRQVAAQEATRAAEEIVRKSMTPQDQERLVRENIEKIQEIVR
jgi:F-type H+-transporting ATPase subunit b